MNAEDIKHRYNVVAIIAAVGAIIALAGVVLAYSELPKVDILDIIVYVAVAFTGIYNIKPSIDVKGATINVIVGILGIVIAGLIYIKNADELEAQSFSDLGIGIWILFIGIILFTIFTISDMMYKRKQ